jgi:Uma2 family endonuclease
MATIESLLTAEQLAALPDDGRYTELVRGRIVDVNPPAFWHGYICARLGRFVGNFVDEHDLGWVVGNDSGVITERDPDTVRGADLAFYSFQRIPKGAMPKKGYPNVRPELVFEVRSPGDTWAELLAKAAEYLKAGVVIVCLIDPVAQRAMILDNDNPPRTLGKDDLLTLPQVLPGFELPLTRLFE